MHQFTCAWLCLAACLSGLLSLNLPVTAQNLRSAWIQQLGGSEIDQTTGLTVDAQHHSYVTGVLRGTGQIGNTTLQVNGGDMVYLAKFDAQGAPVWVRTATSPASYSVGMAVQLTPAGNVLLLGRFNTSLSFGSITLTGLRQLPGDDDTFLAQYDSQGNLLWAKRLDQSYRGIGLALDAAGNIYVAGESGGSSFLSKYDAQGNPLWQQPPGGFGGSLMSYSVAVDGNNNVLLAGSLSGSVALGATQTLRSIGITDAVLAKYDSQGNQLWLRQFGQAGYTAARSVAVAANGTIYFNGTLSARATLGSFPLSAQGDGDVFLASCDAAGTPRWVRQGSSPGFLNFLPGSLTTDAAGNACVVGTMLGTTAATFGTITLTSASTDAFVGRYDAQGTLLNIQCVGSLNSNSFARQVAIDSNDDVLISGDLQHTAQFGSLSVTSRGWHDGFVARFSSRPLSSAGAAPQLAFSAYPNPVASGRLHVVIGQPSAAPGQLRLLNMLGQVVSTQAVATGSTRVDFITAGLAQGRYALQLVNGEAVNTRAVIIQ